MAISLYLVESWTERIVYQIFADGAAQNLIGMTVTLILYRSNAPTTPITYTGTSGIEVAATGKVYFDPASTDLIAGRYFARWKVTDSSGKVAYFPSGAPAEWLVRKP